jgi:hypothetical protein
MDIACQQKFFGEEPPGEEPSLFNDFAKVFTCWQADDTIRKNLLSDNQNLDEQNSFMLKEDAIDARKYLLYIRRGGILQRPADARARRLCDRGGRRI